MQQRTLPASILLSLFLPYTTWAQTATTAPAGAKPRSPLPVRCANKDERRSVLEAGTELWGLRASSPRSAVATPLFTRVALAGAQLEGGRTIDLVLQAGTLRAATAAKGDADSLIGSVLTATLPGGGTVELTICDATPDENDAELWRYNLQYYNTAAKRWQNVCSGSADKAIALSGVWDQSGAHHDDESSFTFACPRGALSRCVQWGYKPWQKQGERTLAEYHQACTRMARADYCGNGKSRAANNAQIEIYDELGIQKPAERSIKAFEAGWTPEGAYCVNRTRARLPVATLLKECPGRFVAEQTIGLSDGESCKLHGLKPAQILIRNRSQGATK